MPGDGPEDADIVIIGEAPGANENKTGHPFIGRSGQLLDLMLERAGISRGDCFVTNMVKCWTGPDNPDPAPDEIEACMPWLDGQIQHIKPRGILTFGRYSTNKFIDFPKNAGIGRVQGVTRKLWWDNQTPCFVMPLYHPAYIARGMTRIQAEDGDFPVVVEYLKSFAEKVKTSLETEAPNPHTQG